MKNSKTLLFLVVLFIVGSIFGLSLTGNKFNKSSTGRFTLAGIPSQYNGKYAYFMGSNVDYVVDADYVAETVAVFGAILMVNGVMKFPQIKGGSVTLPLRYADISYADISFGVENLDSYRRSEALKLFIYIYDHEKVELSKMDDWICNVTFNSVAFSNGSAKQAWSAADDVYERK